MIPPHPKISDLDRLDFLQAVAKSGRDPKGIELTEWEVSFLASFGHSSRPTLWFTPGRRVSADNLRRKYGADLNMPHPDDCVAATRTIAPAAADACEYLVREDGRQRRCNEPATCQDAGRLRYCQMHGEAVTKDCERAKIKVRLIPFP